jgi:hypothetical protein
MANEVNIKFRIRGVIDGADTDSTANSLVTKTRGADTVYEFSSDYYKTFDSVTPKTVALEKTPAGGFPTLITTGSSSNGDVIIFNNVSTNSAEDLDLYTGPGPAYNQFATISPGESMFIVSDGTDIYGAGQSIDTCTVHVIHFETTNP